MMISSHSSKSKDLFSNNLDEWSDTLSDYLSFNTSEESADLIFIIGLLHAIVMRLDSKGKDVRLLHSAVHNLWRFYVEYNRTNTQDFSDYPASMTLFGSVELGPKKRFSRLGDFIRVGVEVVRAIRGT